MRRLFAVVLALTCVATATPSFARGGGHGFGGRAVMRDPTLRLPSAPRVPNMASRIPAPLPAPAQAPVINGPISQPAFRGLSGIGE